MQALYHLALNDGKASDWLRPVPCQQEGDKLPKGAYQSSNGYSTRVHLPGHLACDPSSQREASHVSSQGKEAVFVTHDIYNDDGMFTAKLMNDTPIEIFIDNGTTPSILPLPTYNKFPILHTYPKTESNTPIHTGGGLITSHFWLEILLK